MFGGKAVVCYYGGDIPWTSDMDISTMSQQQLDRLDRRTMNSQAFRAMDIRSRQLVVEAKKAIRREKLQATKKRKAEEAKLQAESKTRAPADDTTSEATAEPPTKKAKKKRPVWGAPKRKKAAKRERPSYRPDDDDPPITLIPLTHDPKPLLLLEGGDQHTYEIEYCKSNKSTCHACLKVMNMKEIRIKMTMYGADHPYSYNFHLPCLAISTPYHLPKQLMNNPSRIKGFDELRECDQASVKVCLDATPSAW